MQSPQSSNSKIFRTFLTVVIIDLAIAFLIILVVVSRSGFRGITGSSNLGSIPIGLGLILLGIDCIQALILIPTGVVLLLTERWEIALGFLLAISAIAFLSFGFCVLGASSFNSF